MANESVVGTLKAILTADPTQFVAGMRQAEAAPKAVSASVANLGKEVTKLAPQAERMVKAFSGDKLLYQANSLTAAVEKLGGASKLTEREQAKVNATVTEAIAKYAALGKTAPASVLALEKATHQAEQGASAFGAMGQRILETAAGFFTAEAAFEGVKKAVELVADALKDLTIEGAKVAHVEEAFDRLTEAAGQSGAALLGALRNGTRNTISDFTLMTTVTQNLAAGLRLTEAQYRTLSAGALALAHATGGDAATALNTMSDAMLTGRTRALALLTGKINETAAEERFAKTLGVTSQELSEEGKLQAKRLAILDGVGAAVSRLGDQTLGLDDRIAQATARWANFREELGRTVATSPVVNAAFIALEESIAAALGVKQQDLVKGLARQIDQLAITLVGVAQSGVTAFGFVIREAVALYKIVGDLTQLAYGLAISFELVSLALAKAVNFSTFGKAMSDDITRIRGNIKALEQSVRDRGAALQEADKAQDSVAKGTETLNGVLAQMRDRMVAANVAAIATAGASNQAGAAARGSAAGFGAQGDALVNTGKDAEEFSKKLRELTRDVARGLKVLSDAEFEKEFASKLAEAGRDMEKFGVIGTKIPEAIRQGISRLVNIELRQLNEQMNQLAARGVPHLEGQTGALDLDLERQASHDTVNDHLVTSSQATGKTLRDIDFARAQYGIDQAKRWGAGWQEVSAMESALSKARLDGEIADERVAFAERTRLLNTTNADDQALLAQYTAEHNAKVQQMVEAWRLGEQQKRDELAMTHNVALRLMIDVKAGVLNITQSVSESFAQMLTGAKSFKDGVVDIWHSIQQAIARVIADILEAYLKALARMVIANKAAQITIGAAGGSGGGGGVTSSVISAGESAAAKAALSHVIGGAAGAGTGAAAGSVAANIAAGTAGGVATGAGVTAGEVSVTTTSLASTPWYANPAFYTNPYTIAAIGAAALLIWGIKKKGWFRGGEEGVQVNPARDKFLAQFGNPSDKGDSGAGHRLAAMLTAWTGKDGGGPLFAALQGAHKMKTFQSAEDGIIAEFARHGVKNIKRFHLGGMVPGNGEVDIRALGGERVLNRQETRAYNAGSTSPVHYHVTQQITIEGLLSMDTAERFRREVLVPLEKRARLLNIDFVNMQPEGAR